MPRRICCFVFVFLTALAGANDKSNWRQVRSEHFIIISNAGEKPARQVAGQFERMRAVFHFAFPRLQVDPGSPIVVLAVNNEKDFRELEPQEYLQKGQLHLGGLFLRVPDKNYVLMRIGAEGDHPYAVIYHEYTHLLCAKAEAWLPLWLDEGLAEFFQNADLRDKDAILGEPSAGNIYLLRQTRLLPLPTLFAVDHTSPYYHEENKGSIFYAEAWALTHYLKVTDATQNTNRLADYADLVSQHVDATTAATKAFGDLQQLQKALERYIMQASFSSFKTPAQTKVDESAFEVRPLPAPQADAVRADFLAYNNRIPDARRLLDAVLQQDPNNAQAQETMGYLAFRDGRLNEARKWYAQAVKADSHSYLAHYYYAAMSMNGMLSDEEQAQIETSLQTSIKLNPSFAPAYDRLAVSYSMRGQKLDQARIMALTAIDLDPGNFVYRMDMANVLLALHQYADAARVARNALPFTKSLPEQARVQMFISQLESHSQSEARVEEADVQSGAHVQTSQEDSPPPPRDNSASESESDTEPPRLAHRRDVPITGPHRVVTGVITKLRCGEPALMDFNLDNAGRLTALHSENYFHISFSALNFTPTGVLKPCSQIEGMHARVEFIEPADKSEKGNILSIELHK